MPWKNLSKYIFIFICFLLMFLVMLKPPHDPDMGWHLQNGKYLLEHNLKIPTTDIYSYTMADFPLIMHEWVTDIFMYLIYRFLGLIGLVIFFTLLTVFAFILVAKIVNAPIEYQMIAALLGLIASLPILGTRAQMVTLFAIALVLFIIYRYRENPKGKIIYFLPLVFLAWVNLHGGFVAGFFILGIFSFLEFIKIIFKSIYYKIKQKYLSYKAFSWWEWGKFLIISALAFMATLINPYTYRVYQEIYRTLTDSYAKQVIYEWMPLSIHNPMSYRFFLYLALLVILAIIAYKKLDFTYLGISLVFLYFPFASWRHLPLFMIISIPFWVYITKYLVGEKLQKIVRSSIFLVIFLLATAIIGYQKISPLVKIDNSVIKLAQATSFPYQAIQYLKNHPVDGNMFNEYNWGGFLIWQYPEKKVFIDGRMTHWEKNGTRILKESQDAIKLNNTQAIFDKYQIKYCFIFQDSALAYVLRLATQQWTEVYHDNLTSIFVEK